MNKIEQHVNKLFKGYEHNANALELKEEVYSNLIARKEDLKLEGMNDAEATIESINSLMSVDHLFDENKKVLWHYYASELLQSVTLYSITIWLLTIPLMLFPDMYLLSILFLVLSVVLSGTYFYYQKVARTTESHIRYLNLKKMYRLKKVVWQIWIGFIGITLISVTGLYFSSNIWFGRPIIIDGPYTFGTIALRYMTPFVTILIPLTVNKAVELANTYEEVVIEDE